jgi:hypothetical protein
MPEALSRPTLAHLSRPSGPIGLPYQSERATRALEAALVLATKRRIPCYPVNDNKRPTCPHGFKDAIADADALRALWGRHPGPLVGIATGHASGIDVLDIDSTKHPEAAEWWEANRDRLPPTRTHVTRSGGLHLLFEHTAGLRCSVGRSDRGLGVLGLDVRAVGGGIIWWPANGNKISCTGPLAAWPDWLLEGLRRPPAQAPQQATAAPRTGNASARAVGALRSAVRRVATAPTGCRNDTLNHEAYSLARFVKDGQMQGRLVAEVLLAAAIEGGLPAPEAYATIASGLRAGFAR